MKNKRKDKQTANELRVFKNFVKVCPYSIDFDSIKKKKPPEPDISCKLRNGNFISFEMVECIDENFARLVFSDPIYLKQAFYTELEKLPDEERQKFKTNFSNASIYVVFSKDISKNKKHHSIKIILDYLLSLDRSTEGEFDFKSHPRLKNIAQLILIQRGIFNGPIFDIEAGSPFTNPIIERIQTKYFEKSYSTNNNIDLLCYYELQPVLPENTWLQSVKEFVETNIERSLFNRFWIYSVAENKIIYVYPEYKNVGKQNP